MRQIERFFVIGHPAVGKAVFSNALAESLSYCFIDADMGLEHRIGLNIRELLGEDGLENYNHAQERILKSISERKGMVCGLDCHIVDTQAIKSYLKSGCVIYLNTTLETQLRRCGSRHQPLINNIDYKAVLRTLHEERDALYTELSEVIIQADNGDIEAHIKEVKDYLRGNNLTFAKLETKPESELIYFKFQTDRHVKLTEKQASCLKLLASGQSAKEIARSMGISNRTVEVYIAQLKDKLGCSSSKELIRVYLSRR